MFGYVAGPTSSNCTVPAASYNLKTERTARGLEMEDCHGSGASSVAGLLLEVLTTHAPPNDNNTHHHT